MKEQKSPARGDFTPSGMAAGRRHSEAQGSVSPSAEGDLRNFFEKKFLKDLQKTFSLLLSEV